AYDKLIASGEEYASVVDTSNGYLAINRQKLDEVVASKQSSLLADTQQSKTIAVDKYKENAFELDAVALAYQELTKAQYENVDGIEDSIAYLENQKSALEISQQGILDEIKAYDVLTSEIEYATSAYKRWLDAKNGPEAGDAYDELSVAMKAIDDGLESGKVGTRKFKAAEELLIPEEVSAQGVQAIQKYKKSMMRYLAEDSDGLQNFIDDMFSKGFLSKDANGQYAATTKTDLQSIAKELNITEEVARSMFLALQDYGWDVEFTDGVYDSTNAIQELADAQALLEEKQKILNDLKLGGDPVKIAQATEELEKQQKIVDDLNSTDAGLTLEEKLAQQISVYQDAVSKLESLGVPAHLLLDITTEAGNLQTQIDAITATKEIIATATAKLDPESLKEEIKALENPLNPDGTTKSPIQLTVDAYKTELYTAAIAEIEALQETPPATVLTVSETGADTVDSKLDDLASKERVAIITVDDTKLSDAEARLAALQAKADRDDPSDIDPPLSVLYSGTGNKATAEDIIKSMGSEGHLKAPFARPVSPLTSEAGKKTESIYSLLGIPEPPVDVPITPSSAPDEEVSIYDTLGLPKDPVPVDVGADVEPARGSVGELMDEINGKTATITVKTKTEGIPGYAKGSKRAKRGVALVGEKGTEIIFNEDEFYSVGHNGPELVSLSGGEEILSNEETKKMFGRSKGRLSGQSFANGNIFSSLIKSVVSFVQTGATAVRKTFESVAVRVRGGDVDGGKPKPSGGGGSSPAPAAAPPEEVKKVVYDFVDWIPNLLKKVRKQTDKIINDSSKQVEFQAQNAELDRAIQSNANNMNLNQQAHNRYMQQAGAVGLSSDLINKIQNGTMDIGSYDEDTRKLISDYEKWYGLAQDALDTVVQIKEEQKELATMKLDNIETYYSNRINTLGNRIDLSDNAIKLGRATGREIRQGDYQPILDDVNAQLRTLREERQIYNQTFTNLVASGVIKQGSSEWYRYNANIQNMDKSILEASISLDNFNDIAAAIPVNNLDIAMKYLGTVQSTLESVQGLREAQGATLQSIDYEQLISVGGQQIRVLEAQNAELIRQQRGLDVLSDSYQELQDKIDENSSSIWGIKTGQEEWNNAIIDLDIRRLELANEQYTKQRETMEALAELEKAKQRRNLVYRDGRGFGYEADQSELEAAQRKIDEIAVSNAIDDLERSKANNNVYDSAGNLIGRQFNGLDSIDFSQYAMGALLGNELSNLLVDAINNIDTSEIRTSGSGTQTASFNGDIIVNGVNDVMGLAEGIRNQLPTYITQRLFERN
ncbi:MAG: hypothetical protein PHX74_04700, partial [Candidatus Sumerlaeales bacterium]|nr:hypothetical protein [Candidatus Sumerlaeales bacterium]